MMIVVSHTVGYNRLNVSTTGYKIPVIEEDYTDRKHFNTGLLSINFENEFHFQKNYTIYLKLLNVYILLTTVVKLSYFRL